MLPYYTLGVASNHVLTASGSLNRTLSLLPIANLLSTLTYVVTHAPYKGYHERAQHFQSVH